MLPCQAVSSHRRTTRESQLLPEGTSLAGIGQERLDEVAAKLNGRRRETLGFATPADKLAELIDGPEQANAER